MSVHATEAAFAALRADGSVVTWGLKDYGGDCSGLQLKNVLHIRGFADTFQATTKEDGLVAWGGRPDEFVDPSTSDQVVCTLGASAAILPDGTVRAWGDPDCGGDITAVKDQLKNIVCLEASFGSFAAVRSDGTVVCWGEEFQ